MYRQSLICSRLPESNCKQSRARRFAYGAISARAGYVPWNVLRLFGKTWVETIVSPPGGYSVSLINGRLR